MKELLERYIYDVYTDPDNELLLFITPLALREGYLYEATGDCCSHTWVEDILGIENIRGQRIIGIEVKKRYDPCEIKCECHDPNHEVIESYGYILKTSAGYIDIECRNESNGYYHGDLTLLGKYSLKIEEENEKWLIEHYNKKIYLAPWNKNR